MSFGLGIWGDAGNVIIDDTHPVMSLLESGRITVTSLPTNVNDPSVYGICTVKYKSPRNTVNPPFVFGIPSPSYGGIGFFVHTGGPGNWAGFRVYYVPTMSYNRSRTTSIGAYTGWDYRVCDFYNAPSDEEFGMRVWGEKGDLLFDSGWAIVLFRGLLKDWSLVGNYKTGRNHYFYYWGNIEYNPNKDCDGTYSTFSHPWEGDGGLKGLLLTQLGPMSFYGDNGWSDYAESRSTPMVGMPAGRPNVLHTSLHYGILQHAGPRIEAMNNFALMSADFSRL